MIHVRQGSPRKQQHPDTSKQDLVSKILALESMCTGLVEVNSGNLNQVQDLESQLRKSKLDLVQTQKLSEELKQSANET